MIKYILLGIIQGITEFFPVSSSGHLVIFQRLLGVSGQEVAVSVILHLGTAVSLVVFFFKDILELFRNLRTIWLIFVVTLITGCIGLLGKDFFEKLFTSPRFVALSLIVTGVILIATKKFMHYEKKDVGSKDAAILGITQGLAIIPGISRSGITISTLLFRGFDRKTSFRFSFLVSIPVIFGAAILELKKINQAFKLDAWNLSVGFFVSLLVGICSLWLLRIIIQKAKLHYFGYYCILIAIITLLFIR